MAERARITEIEREFTGAFAERSLPADLLRAFCDERRFGNEEALITFRRLFLTVETDRGDVYVKLRIDSESSEYIPLHGLLFTEHLHDFQYFDDWSLREAAIEVIDHYDLIVSYLESPEKRAAVKSALKARFARHLAEIRAGSGLPH